MPISTPTRLIEGLYGLGYSKQTDIATASANIWALKKLSAGLLVDQPTIEDDANEFGKAHEFATASFIAGWAQSVPIEKYLTSEMAAWLFAFGLGKVSVTGSSAPYTYTCTPLNPANGDSAEPPYFSWVEQIRPGSNAVIDRLITGMALEEFAINLQSGPGRDASKCSGSFMGSGRMTEPSAVTLGATLAEHLLPANSLALTVNGEDYISSKKWRSLSFGWKNNLQAMYEAGSGYRTSATPASGVIASRMLLGNRAPTLSFTALYQNGSVELAALRSQSTNTVTIGLSNGTGHTLTVTFQKASFRTVTLQQSGDWVVVQVDLLPQYDSTNGLISAVIKTGVSGICQ